jgi:hypothetical protein
MFPRLRLNGSGEWQKPGSTDKSRRRIEKDCNSAEVFSDSKRIFSVSNERSADPDETFFHSKQICFGSEKHFSES